MKPRRGQSAIEYAIMMAIVLAAVLSSNVITKVRSAFQIYFDKAWPSIIYKG